uniref:Beta-lactamase domain-containing protein n=1 Tax=Panagrellus redivivus TaxID=6233 RepID=A0A7E4ZWJ0_PANRE
AETRDFALSFQKANRMTDCNRTLLISDQGYGVLEEAFNGTAYEQPREKRDVGIVYSNQLAAAIIGVLSEDFYGNGGAAERRRLIPEPFSMRDRYWALDTVYGTASVEAVKYVQPRTTAPIRTPTPSPTPSP